MEWEDVRVQLIDMPPITADFMESYVSSMVRAADGALLLVDLGDDDGPFAAEAVLERLAQTKTVLVGQPPKETEDPTIQYVKTLLVANKIDLPDAQDRLEIVREMFGRPFPDPCARPPRHGTGLGGAADSDLPIPERHSRLHQAAGQAAGHDVALHLPGRQHAGGDGGTGASRFRREPEVGPHLGNRASSTAKR